MSLDALKGCAAAVVAAWLLAGTARADVSGYLGGWVNPNPDASGIGRVIVTPAGPAHVRIHLYGNCRPVLCDWGEELGRNHSGSPDSDDVRSIAAEFNAGNARKHLTLRQGPGGSLRFDMVTDFLQPATGHDYESSGNLVALRERPAGPAMASAPLPMAGAVAQATGAVHAAEDCVAINPADVFLAPADRRWTVRDFNHTILNFGANKLAAAKAMRVFNYYGFDEQCYVKRPHPQMIYWRTGGRVPRVAMPGADCVEVNPAQAQAVATGGGWKVIDGRFTLIDYGADRAGAEQAASAVRTYRLNRECFVARPDMTMVYWLSL